MINLTGSFLSALLAKGVVETGNALKSTNVEKYKKEAEKVNEEVGYKQWGMKMPDNEALEMKKAGMDPIHSLHAKDVSEIPSKGMQAAHSASQSSEEAVNVKRAIRRSHKVNEANLGGIK